MAREIRTLISWEDFKEKEFPTPPWLIEPYIPADGIVLLWGETSTGKSPLGWHMAAAVGAGTNFFGLPATQGRVLYLEVDTPQRLVHKRLSVLPAAPGVDFLFLPPLSVPEVAPADLAMLERAAARNYDLVIINTLRKVHDLNDKEPQTPKVVYSFFQHLFPGTALIFVHHTKKSQLVDGKHTTGKEKESFSGAMNWLNDAQVGLFLQRFEKETEGINLRLCHEKSQVSELLGYMGLFLDPRDGVSLSCPKFDRLFSVYDFMHSHTELKGVALDAAMAAAFNCHAKTASRLRHLVEDGVFPGAKWLGIRGHDEDLVPL